MNVKTVAKINEVEIVIIEDGEKRIAIKPICEILGVDLSGQLNKIKTDEILGSVVELISTTGKDGKEYKMQTIPYMFVFGWLFSVHPSKVSKEARPKVIKYKLECYKALYYHFTAHAEFLEEKQVQLETKMNQIQGLKMEFSTAKSKLGDAEKDLRAIRDMKFEDWDMEKRQLKLDLE